MTFQNIEKLTVRAGTKVLAATRYVASGHAPTRTLAIHDFASETDRKTPTPRKRFRAGHL